MLLLVVAGGLYVAFSGEPAARDGDDRTAGGRTARADGPPTVAPVAERAAGGGDGSRAAPSGTRGPPPAAGPFDPAREFERVVAAQSPDFKVEAAADKPQLRINKDNMAFKVKTEKAGYLYVLHARHRRRASSRSFPTPRPRATASRPTRR